VHAVDWLLAGTPYYVGAIAIATLFHGYGGFGFGYISVALFSLLPIPMTTGINVLTLVSFPVAITLAALDRRRNRPDWGIVALLGIGIIIGTPIGYRFVLRYGQTDLFRIVFGALLIAFGAYQQFFAHGEYRVARWTGPLFGVAGGFLGGAIVSGGPPMVVYTYGQSDDPRTKKGTLQLSFLIASISRTALIGVTPGALTREVVLTTLVTAIPVTIALVIGHAFSLRSSARQFKMVVNALILGFGAYLIVQAALPT
jgi:uncharacterized membrane protein YfcA